MKTGTFGSFVVSAEAIRQGTSWTGIFRIAKVDESFGTSTDFLGETQTDGTYGSRAEAEQAALDEGEQWARREESRPRP